MTDQEQHELEKRIALSGMQKQDYLIKSSLHQKVVVIGNRLLFQKMDVQLSDIKTALSRIQTTSEFEEKTLAPLRTILEMLESFVPVEKASPLT